MLANYMHDEDDIIGHITGSYVIDRDGNVLIKKKSLSNLILLHRQFFISAGQVKRSVTSTKNIIAEIGRG